MAVAVKCRLPDCSPRLIGNEHFNSVLVEGEAGGHERKRTQSVSGKTRRWCNGYCPYRQQTDITPYTADTVDQIDLIRERLDAKNLFTINRWSGCTVGSRSSYFPNSSPRRHSVISPEVSVLIEGDAVGPRNAGGENGGDGRILDAWVKCVNVAAGGRGLIAASVNHKQLAI